MKFGTFPADKSKTTMHLKIKSSLFPAQGLLTTLGATLILISLALDFSYGKIWILQIILNFWIFIIFFFSQFEYVRHFLSKKSKSRNQLLRLDFRHDQQNVCSRHIDAFHGRTWKTDWNQTLYFHRMHSLHVSSPFFLSIKHFFSSLRQILILHVHIAIFRGSIALTYFAVDSGLIAVVFSISISHGIAFSLMYAQTIGCVIKVSHILSCIIVTA